MSKQEVLNMVNNLSENQLKSVSDYIKQICIKVEKKNDQKLTEEQEDLLELTNDTINTERGDFAQNHDHYVYGISKWKIWS